MNTLTIAPLATPQSITLAAWQAITHAPRLFLQTIEHPSARCVLESGLPFESMDDLYRSAEDFDALTSAIVQRLLASETDVVYAVPGRGIGEAQRAALCKAAKAAGVRVCFLPSSGYAEAALSALPEPLAASNLRILSATALPCPLDPYVPLCIEEIDTRMRAGEVKLALLEYYPDEFPVWLCTMDDNGVYFARSFPLYMLDRQDHFFAASTLILRGAKFEELTRHGVEGLLRVMKRLRAPGGCPWDAEQTHETLRSDLLEESYEVLDAIDREDTDALCEELGDLMLQVVFHSEIEEELSSFTFRDVCTGIVQKLVYRHPHVFVETHVQNANEVLGNWENLKKKEKKQETVADMMHAVPHGFPALMRAKKIQKKAAHVGFDWPDAKGALDKIEEETRELREAVALKEGETRITEELGDLLFSVVNAARLLHLDSELALAAATEKFVTRFTKMEELILSEGRSLESLSLEELDAFWERIKC